MNFQFINIPKFIKNSINKLFPGLQAESLTKNLNKESDLKDNMKKYQKEFFELFQDFNVSLDNYQEKLAKNVLNTFQDQILKISDEVSKLRK